MKRSGIVKLLLLAAAPAIVLACSSDAAGPADEVSAPAAASLLLNPLGTPARCTPQPYATTTQIVGPKGGELKAGKHKFIIPAGALLSPVQITMESISDTVRSVRFSPEGLVFNSLYLPTLELDYKDCSVPKTATTKVAWTTEQLLILQTLRTRTDSVDGTAEARLQHFSRYALAY